MGGIRRGETASIMLGVALQLVAQMANGARVTMEEFCVKTKALPALTVLVWEGIVGSVAMVMIVYPLLWMIPGDDNGHAENIIDTLCKLGHSWYLVGLVVAKQLSAMLHNGCGILLSMYLSSVARLLIREARVACVWVLGLFVHYCVDSTSAIGARWGPYSFLQLIGCVTLFLGQLVYGQLLKIPGFECPDQTATCVADADATEMQAVVSSSNRED